MKIDFIIPHKRQETVEIDQNASADEVQQILMTKFQFPEGKYSFIYFGNFLPSEQTFKSLPEIGAKVVIFIKTPEEIQHEEEAEQKRKEMISASIRRAEKFLELSQVETLYSKPDIWQNIPEMATMSQKIQESQNLFQFVYHDVQHTICPGRDPDSVLSIMLYMLDYSIEDHLPPVSDIDAEISDLSKFEKEQFNQLQTFCSQHENEIGPQNCTKEMLLQVLKDNRFVVNTAQKVLLQMGKQNQ